MEGGDWAPEDVAVNAVPELGKAVRRGEVRVEVGVLGMTCVQEEVTAEGCISADDAPGWRGGLWHEGEGTEMDTEDDL